MRIIVTRPQADSERTAAALRARGHKVLVAPLMQIEPVAADIRPSWAAVIVTSANAPGAIVTHPAHAALVKLPVFAVGRRSTDACREAGFTNIVTAGGDVRDLVRLIVERRADAVGPLLYLAGEDRAADLIGELHARGIARRRPDRRTARARHRRRDGGGLSRRHRAVSAGADRGA
ncbi:MAG: uroporphyrinogen-III synthase [Pseudolabrys sp.]